MLRVVAFLNVYVARAVLLGRWSLGQAELHKRVRPSA